MAASKLPAYAGTSLLLQKQGALGMVVVGKPFHSSPFRLIGTENGPQALPFGFAPYYAQNNWASQDKQGRLEAATLRIKCPPAARQNNLSNQD